MARSFALAFVRLAHEVRAVAWFWHYNARGIKIHCRLCLASKSRVNTFLLVGEDGAIIVAYPIAAERIANQTDQSKI